MRNLGRLAARHVNGLHFDHLLGHASLSGVLALTAFVDPITAITDPGDEAPLLPEERDIMKAAGGRILLFHPGGPLSFGAAKGMVRRLAALRAAAVHLQPATP